MTLRNSLARLQSTITSITSALNLTSAEIASLELGGYPNLSVLLKDRSVLEVAFSATTGQEQAEQDIALLTMQLDEAQTQLANAREQAKVAAELTPPASPQQVRSGNVLGLITPRAEELKALEQRAVAAEKEMEAEREKARDLEKRLAAAEAAVTGGWLPCFLAKWLFSLPSTADRPASATPTTTTDSAASGSSNARQFIARLNEDIKKLYGEVNTLREENSELRSIRRPSGPSLVDLCLFAADLLKMLGGV